MDKPDSLATEIADEVIADALESVERCTTRPGAEPSEAKGPDPAGAAPSQAELHELREALRAREAELAESQRLCRETLEKLKQEHDRFLRAAADLDNVRKRTAREREEVVKFGLERLVRELLPVADNLERALEAARVTEDLNGLRSGVEMTHRLLIDALGRFGVKGFSALNQPFDPHLHEAMQTAEADVPEGTVIGELVRGYLLNDRLLRPALVTVARARPTPPPSAQPAPDPAAEPPTEVSQAPQPEAPSGEDAPAQTPPASPSGEDHG
jgi:molecular chaperone GrpE